MTTTLSLRRFTQAVRKYYLGYLFIAVPVVSTIAFLLIPMLTSLWWSFNDYSGLQPARFVGLANYLELLTKDDIFHRALRNTTVFVLLGMGIGPTLGIITALLLNQKVHFQSLFRTAYFLPVMTSMVVVATIWRVLYNRSGLLNVALAGLGLSPIGWLADWKVFRSAAGDGSQLFFLIVRKIGGLTIIIFLITFGAPFWNDILSALVGITKMTSKKG